jgi:hypothetical protein
LKHEVDARQNGTSQKRTGFVYQIHGYSRAGVHNEAAMLAFKSQPRRPCGSNSIDTYLIWIIDTYFEPERRGFVDYFAWATEMFQASGDIAKLFGVNASQPPSAGPKNCFR